MDGQGQRQVLGRKFHVSVAGCTNGAHQTYVNDLKGIGQIKVHPTEQSDYLVLFCPIASRVGTDIGEAMDKIPGGKPIVLVVMHHTYDKDYFVPESRSEVENPDVIVTVDVLFYESKMLICNRNDTAWFQVKDVLVVSPGPVSLWRLWTGVLQRVGRCFMSLCSRTLHLILATVLNIGEAMNKIPDIGEAMDKISGMPAVQRFVFWCSLFGSCITLCGWCKKLWSWTAPLISAIISMWRKHSTLIVFVIGVSASAITFWYFGKPNTQKTEDLWGYNSLQ